MLYELAHYIQNKMPSVWNLLEQGNSMAFIARHHREMKSIPIILEEFSGTYKITMVSKEEVHALSQFFEQQPEEAFTFFRPHKFDEKSLLTLVQRKSFLMFLVKTGDNIVGYFFLRCFANGNAFKGRMVDSNHRNQGIAKLMGNVINAIVLRLGLRLFTTISPENYSSLASTKAVHDINIVRILENGYYYIECTPKKEN